jgi:hypothetical protein
VFENVDINAVKRWYFDADLEEKRRVDDTLISHDILKRIGDNTVVTLSKYKTPFGVTNREFLAIRAVRTLTDGSTLIVVQSINSPDHPFTSGYVRGTCASATLIVATEDPNKHIITTVDHIEPKGWIPTMIVNQYKKKVAAKLEAIQRVYQN